MKRMVSILGMVFFCGLIASAAHAESARAVVDTNRLRMGESLSLRVIADFKGARVQMPSMAGFSVTSRGTSSRMQMVNGTTTRAEESLYILVPQRSGALTIPAITVAGRGGSWRTDPITIQVMERGTPASSDALWNVSSEVSSRRPYVGEQVVWTFRFKTAVQFQNARLGKPSFDGFSSESLGEGRAFEQTINGRRYVINEVSELLIPQRAGTISIEPASLSVAVATGQSRRSADPFFNDVFGSRRVMSQKELFTEPVDLTVQPLPAYTGDAPFSGLVGQYSLTAALEKEQVKAGDPLTLTLIIQGTGNIRDAAAPVVVLPEGVKHYSDTPMEKIAMGASGWQGEKRFKTAIVPLKPGTVTLPPITLVWFDPVTASYRTETSGPLRFDVLENGSAETMDVFQGGGGASMISITKREVRLKGQDILPLKVDADAVEDRAPMGVNRFVVWLAGPLTLFLLAVFGLKRFTRDVSQGEALVRRAVQQVKAAERSIPDSGAFHGELHMALTAVMGALSGRPVEGLTGEDIRRIVTRGGGSEESVAACVAILESVASARYGGGGQDDGRRKENVQALVRLMKEVKA